MLHSDFEITFEVVIVICGDVGVFVKVSEQKRKVTNRINK